LALAEKTYLSIYENNSNMFWLKPIYTIYQSHGFSQGQLIALMTILYKVLIKSTL